MGFNLSQAVEAHRKIENLVDIEAARLVLAGVPLFDAVKQARETVTRQLAEKAAENFVNKLLGGASRP